MRFNARHLEHLREHGYVHVEGFMPRADLKAARAAMLRFFPSSDELEATPERFPHVLAQPEQQQLEFPYVEPELNRMATHERVLDLVELALGAPGLLTRSTLWAKYATRGDYEQALHVDFEGNTLVSPRDDGEHRMVNLILYYSDVDITLGPTCVVSQTHTRHLPLWPPFRPMREHRALYQKEKPITARAGDLLAFSMRTFHRATALIADRGERFTHHLIYRSPRHPWQGHDLMSARGELPALQDFILTSPPRRRSAIGFPPPGDAYWNPTTLAEVAARYPGLDLGPYR